MLKGWVDFATWDGQTLTAIPLTHSFANQHQGQRQFTSFFTLSHYVYNTVLLTTIGNHEFQVYSVESLLNTGLYTPRQRDAHVQVIRQRLFSIHTSCECAIKIHTQMKFGSFC